MFKFYLEYIVWIKKVILWENHFKEMFDMKSWKEEIIREESKRSLLAFCLLAKFFFLKKTYIEGRKKQLRTQKKKSWQVPLFSKK